jgi:hypothetical protein
MSRSRSPLTLSATTIARTPMASSDAPRRASPSRVPASPAGWPWKSIAGNFALGTRCGVVTSVERGR